MLTEAVSTEWPSIKVRNSHEILEARASTATSPAKKLEVETETSMATNFKKKLEEKLEEKLKRVLKRVRSGVNPNEPYCGAPALTLAIFCCSPVKIIQELIDAGAKLSHDGCSSLSLAIIRKVSVEVIQALLIAGAAPSEKDLSLAIRIGTSVEIIQKLKLAQKIHGTTVSLFQFMTEKDPIKLINYLEDPKIEKAVLQAINDEDPQISNLLQSQLHDGQSLHLALHYKASAEVIGKRLKTKVKSLTQKIPGTTVSLFQFMTEKDPIKLINYLEDPKIEKAVLQAINDEDPQISNLLQSQLHDGQSLHLALHYKASAEVIGKRLKAKVKNLTQEIPGTTVSLSKFMTEKDLNKLINYLEDPKIEKAVLQAIKDEDPQISNLLQSQFEKTKQREVTNL